MAPQKSFAEIVLIETYWNVNLDEKLNQAVIDFVLIETYWNVNYSIWADKTGRTERLNRNILECKFRCNDGIGENPYQS